MAKGNFARQAEVVVEGEMEWVHLPEPQAFAVVALHAVATVDSGRWAEAEVVEEGEGEMVSCVVSLLLLLPLLLLLCLQELEDGEHVG